MQVEAMQPQKPTDLKRPNSFLASNVPIPVLSPSLATISSGEDGWGEMQSSPVVATPPTMPPSQGSLNKKSESLSGSFPLLLRTPPVPSPTAPSQQVGGHNSATKFDDIIVPKPRNSLDSKSDPSPSDNFTVPSPNSFFVPAGKTSSTSVAVKSAMSNSDPWASADFSFFDSPTSPAVSTPAPTQRAKPLANLTGSESASLAKAPPAPSPLRHGKTRQEIEQDEIVARIVKSLPDLSYMLQR